MQRDNHGVIGKKSVENDVFQLSLEEKAKKLFGRSKISVSSTLSSNGTKTVCQTKVSLSPLRCSKRPSTIWLLASSIAPEVLEPDSEAGAVEVRDHIKDIISEGCIPTDWQESNIFIM